MKIEAFRLNVPTAKDPTVSTSCTLCKETIFVFVFHMLSLQALGSPLIFTVSEVGRSQKGQIHVFTLNLLPLLKVKIWLDSSLVLILSSGRGAQAS